MEGVASLEQQLGQFQQKENQSSANIARLENDLAALMKEKQTLEEGK